LRIDEIAAGGGGVGKLENGRVVFVPRSAPGDVLEAEVDFSAKPARGRILRLIEPSPARVAPPCPYFESCGGCDLMHLELGAQASAHAVIIQRAIAHALSGISLPEIRVHLPPEPLAYRTRARLYIRGERGRVKIGYRAPGSHALVAIDACLVLAPSLAPLIQELAEVLSGAKGEGDVQIAFGKDALPVVEIFFRGELAASTFAKLDAKVEEGRWAGASVRLEGASQASSFGDPRPQMIGADEKPLRFPPGGFAQPSDEGAAQLARRVDELTRDTRPHRVVELFAGSGTLSVLLARETESFLAVEIDAGAAACAAQNLALRGLDAKVTVKDADAYEIPRRTEVVVLDPPRAGAPGASRAIAASSAKVVVYVSCDPPTLARDLAVLVEGGFAITHIEAFELFPQTSHVETVVRLERVRSARSRA